MKTKDESDLLEKLASNVSVKKQAQEDDEEYDEEDSPLTRFVDEFTTFLFRNNSSILKTASLLLKKHRVKNARSILTEIREKLETDVEDWGAFLSEGGYD